jgi:hypothetical protein
MAALAATWRQGRRLDMVELIEQSARLQPLTASFLAELRTASYMQLLLDRGEGMEPYAEDLDYLTTQFIDVAGRDQVEQRTFVGTPLRGLDPDVFTGKVKEWKRPPPNSLVLVLTDLGIGGPTGSRDRASASEWRATAAAVAAIPAGFRVVTPFRPTRWPRGITDIGQIVSWDALVDIERLRG